MDLLTPTPAANAPEEQLMHSHIVSPSDLWLGGKSAGLFSPFQTSHDSEPCVKAANAANVSQTNLIYEALLVLTR